MSQCFVFSDLHIKNGNENRLQYRTMTERERFALKSPILRELLTDMMFMLFYITNSVEHGAVNDKKIRVLYFYGEITNHLHILAHFFPDVEYYLYGNGISDNYLNKFPTNTTVERYEFYDESQHKNFNNAHEIYTISKLPKFTSGGLFNALDNQRDLVKRVNADTSMIDLILPYYDQDLPEEEGRYYDYLNGYIFLNPFSDATSTRAKLVVTSEFEDLTYDLRDYEDRLFYHNISRTENIYYDPITRNNNFKEEGYDLDNSYDSVYLIYILNKYFTVSEEEEWQRDYTFEKVLKYKDFILNEMSIMERPRNFFGKKLLEMN